MILLCRAHVITIVPCICLILAATGSASGMISAYMGETIDLQGYSGGSPTIYLFVTGPNLPVNGVALHDISARADEGHFTIVSVDNNDRWDYRWSTNAIGGRLDAGTYTVWAVDRPNDLSRLAVAGYTTITVMLTTPTVSVSTPVYPGTLELTTSPEGAFVTIGDAYQGLTPLTIRGIEPGSYLITFSKTGYVTLSTPARVEPGKTTDIKGMLDPSTGSLAINTSPPGARILIDTAEWGTAPVVISNLTSENHTVTVIKEGYLTAQHTVQIIHGQTIPWDVMLVPASLTTGTLQAAGNVPGFLMGFAIVILLGIFYRSQ
ncbi:MAG: PEGA domain-containing protein [Methanoregula sp.]|nr:PEGA domain-containing protein [Methanoregula sp.]